MSDARAVDEDDEVDCGADTPTLTSPARGQTIHHAPTTSLLSPSTEDNSAALDEDTSFEEGSTSTNGGHRHAHSTSGNGPTSLAFRAPWATPPKARHEDTTSQKLGFLSPPYSLKSPEDGNSDRTSLDSFPNRPNPKWETSRLA